MGILIYQPTPVLIPEDSACRRDFLSRKSTVDNVPLAEADYREYDSRTIFYDVFRCDDRKMVAIGPPPVNLRNELEKLRITCDGRILPHRKREYRKLCVLELTCDQAAMPGRTCRSGFRSILRCGNRGAAAPPVLSGRSAPPRPDDATAE